jgi:succinate dehydrogenase / fumarate reductase, cytochrome b subunit
MSLIANFLTSSIGRKWIVALTGLVLVAYVLGHLAGNLQIFWSAERINAYAVFLHSLGPILWAIRLFLLACFVAHIYFTIQLALENRSARSQQYAEQVPQRSTTASRTMAISGLIVLCFVIYHLLHFTVQVDPSIIQKDAEGHTNVYNMVILGFMSPFATIFYLLGIFLLCMHLSHGFSSFIQTLGLNTRSTARALQVGGTALAWLVFAGYASIPLSVLFGFLQLQTH